MQYSISNQLIAKAQRFVDAYHELNRGFVWDHTLVKQFGSLSFVQQSSSGLPDIERIKAIRSYIREHTGLFSSFRGTNELMTSMMIYLSPRQEAFFDQSQEIFNALKHAGFSAGSYLPLAAIVLAENPGVVESNLDSRIGRMQQFYQGFKDHHRFLTSQDDYIYAALLACTDFSVDPSIAAIELIYNDLAKAGLSKNNGLQSLSHVLFLGEQHHSIKVKKAVECYFYLASKGYKLNEYHMAFLGVLALFFDQSMSIIDEAINLEQWLKKQTGFGGLTIEKKTRFILAASLCIQNYIDELSHEHKAVLVNSIQAIMMAEQIATTAAIVAITAAAGASSNS